jgi:hypothetical protein
MEQALNKEQKYLNSLLAVTARHYNGIEDIINKTVQVLIEHPAFETWLQTSLPRTPKEKEEFEEVDFYLDMARAGFRLVITPHRTLPDDFVHQIHQARFGGYEMRVDMRGDKVFFIWIEKEGGGGKIVSLYNGN